MSESNLRAEQYDFTDCLKDARALHDRLLAAAREAHEQANRFEEAAQRVEQAIDELVSGHNAVTDALSPYDTREHLREMQAQRPASYGR
jgi:cellobiose-specific phosphotransferase system component IIA